MGICTSRPSSKPYSLGGFGMVNRSSTSSFKPKRGEVDNKLRVLGAYLPLYKATLEGKWEEAKEYLDRDPEALTAKITFASETALHVAVRIGPQGLNLVEKLVEEMSPEDLALKDQQGETPFFAAVVVGNIQAAKILMNKNPDLPNIPSKYGYPIHRAAQFSQKQMVFYLLEVTRADNQPNPYSGENGGYLLIDVIAAEYYDVALELIKRYPEIATVELAGYGSPLSILARKSTAFSSGRVARPVHLRHFNPVVYIKDTMRRNVMERQALELVKRLCEEIVELDDSKVFALLHHALHDAAKLGIPEIIEEIVLAFPPAIWFTDKDNYNVFQLAILHRRENVFNLIYQMTDYRHLITRFIDSEDNNMLHLVSRLPASDRLSLTSGPALLVQREMQWFKVVRGLVHPMQRVAKNKQGKTPRMVFMEDHEVLMKRGAEWMKTTASSLTAFATFIATVAYTGGLNVPGGTNSEGVPYLLNKKEFTLFAVADTLSLLLSIASILTFLSIITSGHLEEDFYNILPRRLIIGIGFLLCSIVTTMMVFCFVLSLLFTPADFKKQNLVVLYATVMVIFIVSMPPLYRYARLISGRRMFGKKRHRLLH